MGAPCHNHPQRPSVRRCETCARAICDACYEHELERRPVCGACAFEMRTRQPRAWFLALAFLATTAFGLLYTRARLPEDDGMRDVGIPLVGVGAFIVFIVLAVIAARKKDVELTERRPTSEELEPQLDHPQGAQPFRARMRFVAARVAPRISGFGTVAVLVVAFGISAALVPRALQLPRLVEVELVVAACWLAFAAVLSFLLYRGYRLRDDFYFVSPFQKKKNDGGSSGFSLDSGCDGCGSVDAEGCAVMLAIAAAVLLLLGFAWILIELALPLAFLLVYVVLMAGLRRVAHDRHGCEGSVLKAIGWGTLWATVYALPVALVVALLGAVLST